MALPLIPIAGLALQALTALSVAALAGLLLDRDFPAPDPAPSPQPERAPFTPPFTGGQCVGVAYRVVVDGLYYWNDGTGRIDTFASRAGIVPFIDCYGAVSGVSTRNEQPVPLVVVSARDASGNAREYTFGLGSNTPTDYIEITSISISRLDGLPDSCGNLPNPNPEIPASDGGGALLPLYDEDSPPELVYAAPPLLTAGGILAALKAIADALKVVGDVLEGVRKIGDAIDEIRKWLEDKEKENPRKRSVSAGGWREMEVDGGFAVALFTAQSIEYSPYLVQIEVESFPSTCSRRLGIKSPSFAHLEPIGWIFPRLASGGYSEPVPIRYLRSSLSLPDSCIGISYSFRENPQTVAKCRVWYSSAPPST